MRIQDVIKKRFSQTTYTNLKKKFSIFSFKSKAPYNNHTTWLDIYTKEPFIRGAIDSKVNAVAGEWTIETVSLKPSKAEEKLIERVKAELSEPQMYINTKLRTIAYRLIIDTIAYIEVSRGDMNFYILNPEECELNWSDGDKYVDGIKWSKDKKFEKIDDYTLLSGKQFAFGSMFDPDTNLFKISPMETIVSIANLLAYARDYNLGIFERGGVPAMLFQLPADTTDEEFLRFDNLLKKAKSGSNIISIGEVKTSPLAGFTKDMEYDKLVNHGVQSIMTNFQVSPQMMSMGGSNSPSGGESARQEMNSFSTGIHNIQRIIDEMMTMSIHKLYSMNDEDEAEDILPRRGRPTTDIVKNLRFKMKKWVDKRQQSAIHKIYADIKVLSPNEIRADLGKEPYEGGNDMIEGAGPMGNSGEEKPEGQEGRGEEGSGSDEDESDSASGESDAQAAERR